MLISKELNEAMNQQVGSELSASNQYIKIASYFDSEQLPELSEFFFRQSDEERTHAMKFVHYILDAGGDVDIPAIEATSSEIDSAETAVKLALDWVGYYGGPVRSPLGPLDEAQQASLRATLVEGGILPA